MTLWGDTVGCRTQGQMGSRCVERSVPKVPPASGLCPAVMPRVLQCSPLPLTALLPLLPSCAAPQEHPRGSSDAFTACTKEQNPPGVAPALHWRRKGPGVPFPAALALLPSSLWEQNQKLCTHSPAVGLAVVWAGQEEPSVPLVLHLTCGKRATKAHRDVCSTNAALLTQHFKHGGSSRALKLHLLFF